jgi:predicted acylesterase/phospholipase RssA
MDSQSSGQHETVLIMQGGGSLGAYECGVYKTLEKHGGSVHFTINVIAKDVATSFNG